MKTACIPAPVSFSDDTVRTALPIDPSADTLEKDDYTRSETESDVFAPCGPETIARIARMTPQPVSVWDETEVNTSHPNLRNREDCDRYLMAFTSLVRRGRSMAQAAHEADAAFDG